MKTLKKLFGGVNLSYSLVIISSIVIGVLVGLLNCVPALDDTTVTDVASIYGFWILCGIFIIMNSKSNKDSAIKCFLFFLISQPLIYLVEVPFKSLGWGLFVYYKFWFIMTILCIPMGYIGYYIKKDKWYGLVILTPIIILLTSEIVDNIHGLIYTFPHHLINLIMVICTALIYPLVIFKRKKIKCIGLGISVLCVLGFMIMAFTSSSDYETYIKCSSDDVPFDESYKVYLENIKLGDVNIEYNDQIESYCINAKFHSKGSTQLIIEDSEGNKHEFGLTVGKNTYDLSNEFE